MKAFKKIVENPKYLGAILVLVLFIGLIVGFELVQFNKIYIENTSPEVGQFQTYLNSTVWNASSGATLKDNFADPFNYSIYVAALGTNYSMFGNSSLEIDASNANSITANLTSVFKVDCGPSGFQNLSITMKQTAPSVAPNSATLTLYSLSDSDSYSYNLESSLSGAATNTWNNLTLPLGPDASGWSATGSPSWGNITALKLNLNYPTNSNITVQIGALFFRGQYQTPIQTGFAGLLEQFLPSWGFWFILFWLVFTAIIFLFFYAMKTTRVWKPIFVATGFALVVMVIRAAVNLIAAASLPVLYYPYDVSLGVHFNFFGATLYSGTASSLTTLSQAVVSHINSATAGFQDILTVMFAISYVWLGALGTIIVGSLHPEFSSA